MNANSVAILTDPHPRSHIVYPYTDEGLVAQAEFTFIPRAAVCKMAKELFW